MAIIILYGELSVYFFNINAIIDFFSLKELYILLKIAVKYISELLTKRVSSLLSDN